MTEDQQEDQFLIRHALQRATDTRRLVIGHGVLREAGRLLRDLFGGVAALIIADENTFDAAGRDVVDSLRAANVECDEPLILAADGLSAEYEYAQRIRRQIKDTSSVPVAIGSGTINDLVKLAAHQSGRQYLCVATAASMDGYTAFGSSLTKNGSKQTFDCPAPAGVVADLEVIARAPEGMNASGYADLLAKVPAGADWLLADSLDVENLNPDVWRMVQYRLRNWLKTPEGIRRGDTDSIRRLTTALMMTGFAMQASQSSRPASGAEHQFSHLWDMENHTHRGAPVSHGFKVGIGSVASLRLYESLLSADLTDQDIDRAVWEWPDLEENDREIARLFPAKELAAKAYGESRTKYASKDRVRNQLTMLKDRWSAIRERQLAHIMWPQEAIDTLAAAGCPTDSEQIGISHHRMKLSHYKAYHIRRRFTILDVMRRANLLGAVVGTLADQVVPEKQS